MTARTSLHYPAVRRAEVRRKPPIRRAQFERVRAAAAAAAAHEAWLQHLAAMDLARGARGITAARRRRYGWF